jgi:hypothetical protein
MSGILWLNASISGAATKQYGSDTMGLFGSRKLSGVVFLVAVAIGGVASAQDTQQPPAPKLGKTQICLRSNGHTEAGACRVIGTGSTRSDICRCPPGTRLTDVSICSIGMKAPKEDGAFRAWRAQTAKGGSLVGAEYQGKPVCVRRH